MPRTTPVKKVCENCQTEFETLETRSRFCKKSCAAQFNGKGRQFSEETKKRISESVRKFRESHPATLEERAAQSKLVGSKTKGKYKQPQSIMDLSTRTISKIVKRLGVGCSQCGWNETVCDIHHINGRKISNPDQHENLTYVCPNCHRKCHAGLLTKDQLVNLRDHIGERWKEFYYG